MTAGRAFLRTDNVLQRSLGAQTMRLQATSHNLANANTPGFKRSAVTFESELRRELNLDGPGGRRRLRLGTTHPEHIPARERTSARATPRMETDHSTTMRNDGNNVDPDREMTELARTQMAYQALTRQVSERYRRVRNVIQQGGR